MAVAVFMRRGNQPLSTRDRLGRQQDAEPTYDVERLKTKLAEPRTAAGLAGGGLAGRGR